MAPHLGTPENRRSRRKALLKQRNRGFESISLRQGVWLLRQSPERIVTGGERLMGRTGDPLHLEMCAKENVASELRFAPITVGLQTQNLAWCKRGEPGISRANRAQPSFITA